MFEENGYAALTPGWPDDPETVEEATAHPEVFAGKSIGQVADHFDDDHPRAGPEAGDHRPLLRRAARPRSWPGAAWPRCRWRSTRPPSAGSCRCRSRRSSRRRRCCGNPANRNRAVPLTYEQFRYGFANAVSEDEAKQLYETFAVPAPGKPLFQAAAANLNPWTEAKVDTKNPDRGPLLIISGEKDHTVPWAIANASFKQQEDNQGVTEIVEIKGRGHALTIDSGWREVADTALAFVKRFT